MHGATIKITPNIVQNGVSYYLVLIDITILYVFILHIATNQTYSKYIRENAKKGILQIFEMKQQ